MDSCILKELQVEIEQKHNHSAGAARIRDENEE